MENQHRKISGYRELDAGEIARMNEGKDLEISCLGMLDKHLTMGADARWMAIARTHIQQGFMAAVRAVAKTHGYEHPPPAEPEAPEATSEPTEAPVG